MMVGRAAVARPGAKRVTDDDAEFSDPEFQAQLAALRRKYVQGLPARQVALARAWRDCAAGAGEPAWQQVRDVAHKLAGSASSYGFDALGSAGRELDRLLSGRAPSRDRALVEPLVRRLAAALDAVITA